MQVAGLPIKTVRDAIREMSRHDGNDYGWSVERLGDHLKISATHAEWICDTLQQQGILERAPQPDGRWHSPGMYYRLSPAGTRFTNASMLKRIDRARVDRLLADLLERVKEINANDDLCYFVNEIRLFGSALDKKGVSFSDVDICYVLERRKTPSQYKDWTDWSIARAEQGHRQSMQYFEMLNYGETEVKRLLKSRSPYISLHDLNDVMAIGAESVRLYVAPEGGIEAQNGSMSGEALSQAAMNAAVKNAATRDTGKSTSTAITAETPRIRLVRAIKSLAFDMLRAIDETVPLEALERSIVVAHESIEVYRREGEMERVEDILRKALSIEIIEQEKAAKTGGFIFSEDRERWAHDGTNGKLAAKCGMKHAVIEQLKCTIADRRDSDLNNGMIGQFEAYRRAEYDSWKYRQEHGYDWYGPERLSDRAVVTLRRIANGIVEKLDKQALKTLSENGFIKLFRKIKWRLTAKGERAIKYHDERDAWLKKKNEIGGDSELGDPATTGF